MGAGPPSREGLDRPELRISARLAKRGDPPCRCSRAADCWHDRQARRRPRTCFLLTILCATHILPRSRSSRIFRSKTVPPMHLPRRRTISTPRSVITVVWKMDLAPSLAGRTLNRAERYGRPSRHVMEIGERAPFINKACCKILCSVRRSV